jgi:Alw26I/Eco31I/Esp3I family type II restriction endonuclease
MGRVAEYGRGHPRFLKYIKAIVDHPEYAGMPDVYLEDGRIQWEAPSNRPGGKYQFTHQRRLDWWRRKARSIGVDPERTPKWISETAKRIHPFKRKPCKNCGRELEISYVYPTATLVKRLQRVPYVRRKGFDIGPLESIREIIARLHAEFGDRVFEALPALLKSKGLEIPLLPNKLTAWRKWIEETYIPSEPHTLGPGVMSNAPDRLDGFHSFNRCCRHKADLGRSRANLQSYTVDRRAFEYWVDGDWVAADSLMGLIRSHAELRACPCRHGHPGPCSADHIGPISLGFRHRPEFQFLCRACNSAKNNRLTLEDVEILREVERRGEPVASRYCESLWQLTNRLVTNQETALRLSKVLRDNRHTALMILGELADEDHLIFLCTFLGLEYAEQRLASEEFVVDACTARFRSLVPAKRAGRYVGEQKARRIRVAFEALEAYLEKDQRNAVSVIPKRARRNIEHAKEALADTPRTLEALGEELAMALEEGNDEKLRRIAAGVPSRSELPKSFRRAKILLEEAMEVIANELRSAWGAPRYVRAEANEEPNGDSWLTFD